MRWAHNSHYIKKPSSLEHYVKKKKKTSLLKKSTHQKLYISIIIGIDWMNKLFIYI